MNRAILVKTCQSYSYKRDACEQAWAHAIRQAGVPVFFVQGLHYFDKIEGSLIMLRSADDRCGLTEKVRQSLQMLAARGFDYIFVVDDDTFVHPRRFLAHEPRGDLECRLFFPVAGNKLHHKINGGKPWAHGGGGYWMSRRLQHCHIDEVRQITRGDDVIVAKVAQRHAFEIVHRSDLYGGDRFSGHNHRVAADNQFITCHHVEPGEMRALYEATKEL